MAVEILESCIVAPPSGMSPKQALWLSNLDHQFRKHTPMVFVYRRPSPGPKDFFSPEILKAALSKALVPFYPLAGRLVLPHTDAGRTEIRRTSDGVLFVTARTDATLDDMGDLSPSDQLRRMLVPSPEGGDHAGVLVMFQVTCVFSVDTARNVLQVWRCVPGHGYINHMTTDGRGFARFLNTWAAIARGAGEAAAMPRPFHGRTLLRARSPPTCTAARSSDHNTEHDAWPGGGDESKPEIPFVAAITGISKHQVEALKRGAGGAEGNKNVSTFSAVSAHVWQCMCKARGLAGTETTRLHAPADIHSRVRPPLPDGYLGKALVCATAVAKVEDVLSGPVHATAARVAGATARLSDEYIRSLVDRMEECKSYQLGSAMGRWGTIPDTDVYVVSWLGVPYLEVDFGWGRPAFVGRATMMTRGAVYLVPGKKGNDGGLDVVVAMEPERLPRFKELFYEALKRCSSLAGLSQRIREPCAKL